jgi:hypothetical protein
MDYALRGTRSAERPELGWNVIAETNGPIRPNSDATLDDIFIKLSSLQNMVQIT